MKPTQCRWDRSMWVAHNMSTYYIIRWVISLDKLQAIPQDCLHGLFQSSEYILTVLWCLVFCFSLLHRYFCILTHECRSDPTKTGPSKPGTTKLGQVDISSWQCRKLRKISPNFACFGPHYFRGQPPKFWTCIEIQPDTDHVTKFHGDRRSCETSIKVNIINQSIKQTHKETIFTWPAYVAVLLVHRRQSVDVQQVVRKRLPEQMCLEEATKCGQ